MYIRPVHAVLQHHTLRSFIRGNPLGILTTGIVHPNMPFLQSSHIPFLIDDPSSADTNDLGALRGHIALANPQAKALIAAALVAPSASPGKGTLPDEVLVLFTGTPQAYITPSLYTETKPATGKVVPTWDYVAVQAYGRVTVYHHRHGDDAASREETDSFLQKAVGDLTNFAERDVARKEEGREWKVGDAPESYVNALKRAIIGIEIKLTRLEGRWKMGQELSEGDRKGVVDGMRALGTDVGGEIASVVEEMRRTV
ncbi:hypothetical protein SERLADRAFT_374834 [Serpula lacrymans var. lacrymans S7.9]|uniref:Transcriptional regulator n=1 Tax=Serpula lacrymans var. lacrymans (strain S7.9) TaxID=578457 RepID=F8PD23_SERL9|nr:uncharacterized protein SERLADRAFT_374834 [Serpula lacrymans var. lacrymans S7.9]EGO19122.1 hypothetical protein SERLADRAFT_374834 [Serpula lacrymans var. lacrymans S7.9]